MKLPIWHLLSLRQRKLIWWSFGLLAFYTLAGFFILPPIIRTVAVRQLAQQLDREVAIREVRFNPFALSIAVDGLLIKDKDGEPFVSWDEVYVNFQLVSLFGKAWTFKEISTTKPYVRAQMNRDGSFNFSDIINKFTTNAAGPVDQSPARPFIVHVNRVRIAGATAALTDFTTRVPFKRMLGPLDITLDDFDTDSDNKNPYSFTGTTDAGEQIAWSGFFYLTPLRSQGELKLSNFTLNKYLALYQDLVRFEIRDGAISLDVKYRLELSATNRVLAVADSALALRNLKLGATGDSNNLVELSSVEVLGANADLHANTAAVDSVAVAGAKINLQRAPDNSVNVVELARPAETATNVSGGVMFLLRSVTNVVAMLLESTNQWRGTLHSVTATNCDLHLEDRVNSRPAKLDLTGITLAAQNLSNIPGTNLTAALSLRWNTNGSIQTTVAASFQPPTADIQLKFDQLDLGTLDPYLEPNLNLFILGSKVGLHGAISLRMPPNELPQVTFHGDASLDAFHTVDGVMAEDLVKWDTIGFHDIDANLNPQSVAIREIIVDGVYARLIIETNRTINLLNALRLTNTNAVPTNATEVAAAPKTAAKAALPPIAIGAIFITNTAVSFSDRSISPNVNLTIQSVNGTVAGLSTEQLQHADVTLNALVDGIGPVNLTGTLNPFNDTQTNVVNISVRDMDLTPASAYAGKFAGYRIAEGKLNLDLAYQLTGKNLTAKNVITLDQFSFGEKVDSSEATHLPVRLAVAILKDRNGKIVLDVPVEGRLDDPTFRIGKVVSRAIVNILEKVALSPFSLLGAVFGGGGEELAYQDFAPGSAELTAAAKQKLDSLVKGLLARPELKVELSGSIDVAADRDGLKLAALERELRLRQWQALRQAGQATNSVSQVVLTSADRKQDGAQFYGQTLADDKNPPQPVAAHASRAAIRRKSYHPIIIPKGATLLQHLPWEFVAVAKTAAVVPRPAVIQTTPAPAPKETGVLPTFQVSDSDLETLAANRAQATRDYLLQTGQVEAARVFLKTGAGAIFRRDGCRAYLQFR